MNALTKVKRSKDKAKRQRDNWKAKYLELLGTSRIFEHFPQTGNSICPICGTKADIPCFLIPIDGTQRGGNCEDQPVHVQCITQHLYWFNYGKELGVIYIVANIKQGDK